MVELWKRKKEKKGERETERGNEELSLLHLVSLYVDGQIVKKRQSVCGGEEKKGRE